MNKGTIRKRIRSIKKLIKELTSSLKEQTKLKSDDIYVQNRIKMYTTRITGFKKNVERLTLLLTSDPSDRFAKKTDEDGRPVQVVPPLLPGQPQRPLTGKERHDIELQNKLHT